MGLLVDLDQFLPLFTEDGELTTSAASACGNSDRDNLPPGVDIDGVYIPALIAPGRRPVFLFACCH